MTKSFETMSLPDALNLARIQSGKTIDEIQAEMSWKPGHAQRVFYDDSYWPSLPTLPKLCGVLGNTILLDWLQTQVEFGGLALKFEALDCIGLLRELNLLVLEMGEVSREAERAVADGTVDRAEARRICKEMRDVLNKGIVILNGLEAIK